MAFMIVSQKEMSNKPITFEQFCALTWVQQYASLAGMSHNKDGA